MGICSNNHRPPLKFTAGTKVFVQTGITGSIMVFAEDIRKTILKLADEKGPEQSFRPSDVAQRMDRENWQSLMDQVWFVASVLVKEGKIRKNQYGDSVMFSKTAKY